MAKISFFARAQSPTLHEIAQWAGAVLAQGADAQRRIDDVAPLEAARPEHLAFLDNPAYAAALKATRAGAVLVSQRYADLTPVGCVALITPQPYRAMAQVLARLFPSATRPGPGYGGAGLAVGAHIHPTARLEHDVTVDPGAVIGPRVEIGAGAVIASGAVIGADVRIGRQCSIGANASVQCALIGDRVILHPGVHIGQDGFGFAMGPGGHLKVPQIGRVIIQDDVEIGAGTTIDRGANRDSVIGEGTKIDNLVQIGHNVMIGRHCVIVAQVGISGSCVIEDYVAIGGQSGIAGHLRIGAGAQIAACSGVMNNVPAGARWGGTPAKPLREFFREIATLKKLAGAPGASPVSESPNPDDLKP